jgi:glycine betaine/choline ABC-type transport system substrate-binding protein
LIRRLRTIFPGHAKLTLMIACLISLLWLFSAKSHARFSVCVGGQVFTETQVLFAATNIYPGVGFDQQTAFTTSRHRILSLYSY